MKWRNNLGVMIRKRYGMSYIALLYRRLINTSDADIYPRHIYYEGITANPGGPTAQTTSALALRTHFPALPQRLPPILGFPAGTTTAQSAVVPAPTRRIRRKKRTAQDADLDVKEEEEDEKAGCCKAPVTKKRKRDDRKDDDDGAGGAAGAGIAC